MARPRRTDPLFVVAARQTVGQTADIQELRQALAVLLPAEFGATLEQTARVLGVGRATVPRWQRSFRQCRTADACKPTLWGGRRRALMSAEAEVAFLRPWVETAKGGGVLVLSPIRAALAQVVGRPVAASVVYRLLARHGWRKVAPDTRHPKNNPQAQEDWKKNSRRICRPC